MVCLAILTVRVEALEAFREFETQAARIMARHGGAIERTMVEPSSVPGEVTELHWVTFPDRESFDAYRQDPALDAIRHLREASVIKTELRLGEPGPAAPLPQRTPVSLSAGEGRAYEMGSLRAVFKADGNETQGNYSISEWWLDPYTRGPGQHQHEEDDVFFVLEGTMSFFVGGRWLDAPKGAFVIAPANTPHDFENRTGQRAGALNISVPGNFERHMPGIAEWFRQRSAADSRTANAPAGKGQPEPGPH